MSLIIRGCLSAFVSNFAGAVPPSFSISPMATSSACRSRSCSSLVWLWRPISFCVSPGSAPAFIRRRQSGRRTFCWYFDDRIIIYAHIICSLCATVAGIYLASRLRSGAPWIGSDGVYDLESIAVVVIGGTILAGGQGGIWGTVAGVMIFSLIDSIFNVLGVDAFVKQVLRGVIIVAAVAFYTVRSKRLVA